MTVVSPASAKTFLNSRAESDIAVESAPSPKMTAGTMPDFLKARFFLPKEVRREQFNVYFVADSVIAKT
jgi:hypothetical protein